MGFSSNLLMWIESYLRNRTQTVIFKDIESSSIFVTSGVPQGSHIGPLLFILFILNRFPNDSMLFQQDLNSFLVWGNLTGMSLNVKKCFIMSFTRSKYKISFNYNFASNEIMRVSKFNDLGVYFEEKKVHCKQIFVQAVLYCSLVRSPLEYCSPVWNPLYEVSISRIESIQKQFLIRSTRYIRENYVLPPYKQRLKDRNLHTLQDRRLILNLCFMFSVINGRIDCKYIIHR